MKFFNILLLVELAYLCLADTCTDLSPQSVCDFWRSIKLCDPSHPNNVLRYCRKTCGKCDGGTIPTFKPTSKVTQPTYPTPPKPWTDKPSPGVKKCGVSLAIKGKIVGGSNAKKGAWPWIASLQRLRSHFCGGTLIHRNWILTAAHCVERMASELSRYEVVLGAHNLQQNEGTEQRLRIARVIRHPYYNKGTLKADFALLELQRPAMLNTRVQLACLPSMPNRPPRAGKTCYLAGWGSTSHPGRPHPVLQQVELPVVSSGKCEHNSEVVCVGKGRTPQSNGRQQPNACRGDSGGPLVCQNSAGQWVLEGAASYVVTYCKYYTGYSPVHKYYSWIFQYVPQ